MSFKYKDLVQFSEIESVIQIADASISEEAEKLVSTYVISDEMAKRVTDIVLPHLSFDNAIDHKGLLVVGNYGTGKSHLMSVVSLVAEDTSYVKMLTHPDVKKAASSIAGKFKVHRIEISSEMPLRSIVTQQLEIFLKNHGVNYRFPSSKKSINNKISFEEMMAEFESVYPNHGVLLVIDEFLDYLRSRKDNELALDLSFLREIGEVTKHLRFRFIAGVQEAIFDSSRFQHAADSLRRVNDRFIQVRIDKQDVAFVVAERLLKKGPKQKEMIYSHLKKFSKYYKTMNEKMDEYVRLFPVHPDYIATFERMTVIENRGALTTLRDQIEEILNHDVPDDNIGIISYDRLWEVIRENAVFRSHPNIGPVTVVSETLLERVQKAFTRQAYKDIALRIVSALSVHRLTTGGDINIPVGPTAEELRDTLCLFHPGIEEMGGEPDIDLLSLIQATIREILKTVNGQFISKAKDSDQYYLDLKKDIDFDTKIEERSEMISHDALDRAYYSVIRELMECADEATYVTGHQIWQYHIEWHTRKVERDGYLFFGSQNDRPTAQPERDFYIYFVQPFETEKFQYTHNSDEVFFQLTKSDLEIERLLALYAASQDLGSTSSGNAKSIYQSKTRELLQKIAQWLRENQLSAYKVTYQGTTKALEEYINNISMRERSGISPNQRINFRDVVNIVSSITLEAHFSDTSPEYPVFSALITRSSQQHLISSAFRALATGNIPKDTISLFDGLEMIDGNRIDPTRSRYACEVLGLLKDLEPGKVLNRSELVFGVADVEYFSPSRFRLEPELLIVILSGLVYTGDIVLTTAKNRIDAGSIDLFCSSSFDDIKYFKHIELPKETNIKPIRKLFDLLKLPADLAQRALHGSDEAIKMFYESASNLSVRALEAQQSMNNKLDYWGRPLWKSSEIDDYYQKLSQVKTFSEGLLKYNTAGRMKNIRIKEEDLSTFNENLITLEKLEFVQRNMNGIDPVIKYISHGMRILPQDDPWIEQVNKLRVEYTADDVISFTASQFSSYRQKLMKLKEQYISAYILLHNHLRLDINENELKQKIVKNPKLLSLRRLSALPLMPSSQLSEFGQKLDKLIVCRDFIESDLKDSPVCPHCELNPALEKYEARIGKDTIVHLSDALDHLYDTWINALIDNLKSDEAKNTQNIMSESNREYIHKFASSGELPSPVSDELISALNEALSGLEKVTISLSELKEALGIGGSPVAIDALRCRFDGLLESKCSGKKLSKLRVVIE